MKYYYKLINNETNEIESYVESSGCIRPENICHILGLSGYHAVSCTKQEYEERNMMKMTLNDFSKLATGSVRVRSGFNGKLLTSNFNPNKHSETLGKREVISVKPEMILDKTAGYDTAYPVICCLVNGREEYEKWQRREEYEKSILKKC